MNKVVEVAESFIGQKEVSPNKSFVDPEFLQKMKNVGWKTGDSWCAYFAKLVWKDADQVIHPFSGNALQTYRNFEKIGRNGKTVPVVGALVVWRSVKDGKLVYSNASKTMSPGHIGIVTNVHLNGTFDTIEGNTTVYGGREGIVVARRLNRTLKWSAKKTDKTQLVGFIYPE